MGSREDTSEVDGLVAWAGVSEIREGVGIGSGECDIRRGGKLEVIIRVRLATNKEEVL
jgi:hypothetical protein